MVHLQLITRETLLLLLNIVLQMIGIILSIVLALLIRIKMLIRFGISVHLPFKLKAIRKMFQIYMLMVVMFLIHKI